MIRVVLADDHPVVRFGLRVLVNSQDDMQVVGTAADGLGAVASAVRHVPDVVVLDLFMPVFDGLEATEEIVRQLPGVPVLLLTTYNTEDIARSAAEAGAAGVALKAAGPWEVLAAIRAARRGEPLLSGRMESALAYR